MSELPVVEFVRLDNKAPIADSVVEARLGAIELGSPLDVDAVERAMNTVYGLDYYQNVRYGLVTENGQTGIEVELDERAWGPNYLQLGMEYSSAADSDALFGLAASYLRTAINPLGGEWRTTIIIGDEPALISDLYQPFGSKGLYFYTPSFHPRVESVQGVYDRRSARHGGAAARGHGRVSPSDASCRRGASTGSACAPRRGEFDLRVGDPSFHLRRGLFPARRVLRPLLRRHDGRRSRSRARARRASLEYRLSRQRPLGGRRRFRPALAVSRARTPRRGAGTRC